mgnify:CR=1 FL=1
MSDHVILLHGLWMRGFSMLALRQRLLHAGFAVHGFEYASVAAQPQRTLQRLRAMMRGLADRSNRPGVRRVHLVGHSLGGLVALQAVRHADELPPGRIVCIGTPLTGSAAARGLAHWPVGQMLFGHSAQALLGGLVEVDAGREVGMIAGSVPHGLGNLFGHFEGEHDGTVAVEETRLPGLAGHCTVRASHSGLLFSPGVARQTAAFLRTGRFRM